MQQLIIATPAVYESVVCSQDSHAIYLVKDSIGILKSNEMDNRIVKHVIKKLMPLLISIGVLTICSLALQIVIATYLIR